MISTNSIFTLGVVLAANMAAFRLVTWGGGVPAAKAAVKGVTRSSGVIGERVPVDMAGLLEVTTGGAFAVGDALETDNQGRAVIHTDGIIVARAESASTGPGLSAAIYFFGH